MSSVLFEIRDHIAFITLNRPEKYNAFNREMSLSMQEKLRASESPDVRCVYITGNGKAFSSGQDLEEVVDPEGPAIETILGEHYNPIIKQIRNLEKPVVAAVNGVAAGAGANIAFACDIVVASTAASFIQAFSKIGLVPDSGGTYILPRLIGWQKASALMMMGEKIHAEEAERMGMVFRVFEEQHFSEEAGKIALTLARMPTRGLAFTKQLLNSSMTSSYDDQLLEEERLQKLAGSTHDYKEGVQAFLEKRKPLFKGE